jgi:hypothetical protein
MDWRSDDILARVDDKVKAWHDTSKDACMREWFYKGHVKVVADYAALIAEREGMSVRVPVLASLLHDVARTACVEGEPELTAESERMAREAMAEAGVADEDVEHVCQIMAIHSCRGEVRPTTKPGKVMTTADAMAHVMTDFYFMLPFKGWLTAANDFEGYRNWVCEKTKRDLNNKIFYEPERILARPRVAAFQTLFGE